MKSSQIIKKNYEFDRVYQRGKQCHMGPLSIFYLKRREGPTRYGYTVSRKVRGAVQRNRVKRVLRELSRAMGPETKDRYDILLLSRSEARPGSYQKLARTYEKLLAKADLLCDGQDWDQD
ncbi:MAG: ribonuclease P protein component [Eubacteriales bacterium]|nr:ribonuclease P protein component [Clostridiales bacterium]MDY5836039.1 ribonuclease P protein component [Eubacteriales bacterium]